MYPSFSQIKMLHRKYAPSEKVFELVFTHCQIVWDIAEQLTSAKQELLVKYSLVYAGALLHDIGAYRFISGEGVFDEKNYVRHTVEGFAILTSEGLSKDLCRIAESHIG